MVSGVCWAVIAFSFMWASFPFGIPQFPKSPVFSFDSVLYHLQRDKNAPVRGINKSTSFFPPLFIKTYKISFLWITYASVYLVCFSLRFLIWIIPLLKVRRDRKGREREKPVRTALNAGCYHNIWFASLPAKNMIAVNVLPTIRNY